MDKIIIFGSNGMLGRYLYKYFEHKYLTIGLTRNDYDVLKDEFEKIEKLLINNNINDKTLVINCIGLIPQASKNYQIDNKMFIQVNTLFPNILVILCNKYNAKIIIPSTDCVFSGSKGKYTEIDKHDEHSIYAITKSLGESNSATVIRSSIIGEEIYNKRSLIEWIKSNKGNEINGFLNHKWNGITCLQYAKVIEIIIQKNIFWKGIKHIFSPNIVTKFDIIDLVNNIYNLNIKINPTNLGQNYDRSLDSIYDCQIFNIPDLKQQIIELKNFNLV